MAVGNNLNKCGSCQTLVKEDCEAFQCEGFCEIWFHANCVNVTSKEFAQILKLGVKSRWMCDKCVARIETMRNHDVSIDEFLNLHEMVVNLIGLVKKVVNGNIELNNKLDMVISNESRVADITSKSDLGSLKKVGLSSYAKVTAINKRRPRPAINDGQILNECSSEHSSESQIEEVQNLDNGSISDSANVNKSEELSELKYNDNVNQGWIEVNSRRKKMIGQRAINTMKLAPATHRVKSHEEKVTKPKMRNECIIVGTADLSQSVGLTGAKKAWFHLGKVAKGTTVQNVDDFVKKTFPKIDFSIEKLESKGLNDSFKLGVEFIHKDTVAQCSVWPKNITLKRFLFWRTQQKQLG